MDPNVKRALAHEWHTCQLRTNVPNCLDTARNFLGFQRVLRGVRGGSIAGAGVSVLRPSGFLPILPLPRVHGSLRAPPSASQLLLGT